MTTAPKYDVDFFGDDFIRDPIPRYGEMRELGPVLWLPQNGVFAFPCYQEVVQGLRNTAVFRSGRGLSLNEDYNRLLVGSTLNSDDEDHDRQRAVTAVPIMPKSLAALDEQITITAEALADRIADARSFDAVSDLAQVLPLSIVVDLVGLNDAGSDNMLTWAAAAFDIFEGSNDRARAAFETLKELQKFLQKYGRKEALKPGGLARRIFEVAPKHGFTEAQAAQLMRDYIPPSLDTTISATGFAAYYFAKNPDQWDLVRSDNSLIPNAIEEVVRLSTPIRAFSRYVETDIEVASVTIPQGSRAMMIYASANRDETVFENPDRFDVTRNVRKHVGFGHGVHACMGMHLARLEMRRLFEALVTKVKHWHLDGTPEIAMNNTIRAFSHLPMRITPVK